MNNLVTLTKHNSIALIAVNSPPVNALSQQVRSELIECFTAAQKDDDVAGIILHCQGRTFIAGADITEFGKPPLSPDLNAVISTIEGNGKPVLAALHGTALGGGFEVAMACDYRLAERSAKVGLPEVLLGLIPGAGGTQRLPRLVGAIPALDIMVSGKPISASKAEAIGAVDKVVDDELVAAAIAYMERLLADNAPLRPVRNMSAEHVSEDSFSEYRRSIAKQARGYFAPERIIQAVQAAVSSSFDDGLAKERELFIECLKSPESEALRHLFFSERQAAKIPDINADTPTRTIKQVAVVGAGTMGGGIAMNFIQIGIPVRIVDISHEAIERGLATIRKNYERALSKGKMTEADIEKLMSLLIPTINYSDLSEVDLVIEAAFENMQIKKEIFRKLDGVCKQGAMLATNTSTLDVDEIAAVTQRPADVLGLHFFSPANVMRLLEVVRGEHTALDVLATAMKLSKKINKIGVMSGVCFGFIGNRMLHGYGREAGLMLLEGATPEQIDKLVYDFGFPMGPFAVSDLAGNDVGAKVREERAKDGFASKDERDNLISDKLYQLGRFGQKTAAGFYNYEDGARTPQPSPEVKALIAVEAQRLGIEQREIDTEEIITRCIYPLINEGARILEEGIALRASDIDLVWINGYGFPPYRGGPMFYADQIGLRKVYDTICRYRDTFGNEFGYWEPAPLLEKLALEGKSFAEYKK
ncbi:3-hydroxyacyl-CoA dehydrogenase NAD-binding domain-containing protein [Agarilytica rhodophyticola]|uniref:3-hydroxyacyl-CoA dehydrogenase NAD-binding domain-containing protein n=1 Tax=Agarilytica rhodophyticola TaxID=1737490 RepID=UPI000B343CBF|nr:3-hydroxyacyl-CoA dehydrogenase NAD-binding domain-containing protein [Agarilytica rhodophyticola]